MPDDKAKWLAGLKGGDPVVVKSNFSGRTVRVDRIKRFTKTLIVTEWGYRVRRRDGETPSVEWHFAYTIEKPTAAQARKAKAEKAGG